MTRNVTLSIDAGVLREARRIAAERATTLNALIREFLQELTERESGTEAARRRILAICKASAAGARSGAWSRNDLHER